MVAPAQSPKKYGGSGSAWSRSSSSTVPSNHFSNWEQRHMILHREILRRSPPFPNPRAAEIAHDSGFEQSPTKLIRSSKHFRIRRREGQSSADKTLFVMQSFAVLDPPLREALDRRRTAMGTTIFLYSPTSFLPLTSLSSSANLLPAWLFPPRGQAHRRRKESATSLFHSSGQVVSFPCSSRNASTVASPEGLLAEPQRPL